MSTQTITHHCGHATERDLSFKKPFERAGFAKWLGQQPCRNCDPKEKARTAKFVTDKRAEELTAARAVEKRFQLEPLDGPPSIIEWGTRIRADLVADAFDGLELDEDDFAEQIAGPASEVNSAGWWLDHREVVVADLAQTLASALADSPTNSENPF